MRARAWLVAAVTIVAVVWMFPMPKVSARSASGVVISEYRFRGPNGPNDEFVELFNAGSAPVNISGWMVRASNNNQPPGVPSFATRVTIPANTILGPGCFYLVTNTNQTQPYAAYSGPVVGNSTYTIGFGDDGGVALTTRVLTEIVDQVGQGTAPTAYGEGQRLPMVATNTNRGIERLPGNGEGHNDTDNNFADFREIDPPTLHNFQSPCLTPRDISVVAAVAPATASQGQPLSVFGQVTPATLPGSTGIQVVGDLSAVGGSAATPFFDNGVAPDAVANDRVYSAALDVPLTNPLGAQPITLTASDTQGRTSSNTISVVVNPPPVLRVPHEIQGAGAVSPFAVGTTASVRGVVTARASNGFFMQTEAGLEDADAATSEGLFVYTNAAPPASAQPGRVVIVTAAVAELVPTFDAGSPSLTALSAVQAIFDMSAGSVPDATELTGAELSSAGSIDQLERFEGMRVHVASLTAVSGSGGARDEVNNLSVSDGAFFAVLSGQARTFREPGVEAGHPVLPCAVGPCNVPLFDGNPERLRVDSDGVEGTAAVDVRTGAVVADVTGPLGFAARSYTLMPETTLAPTGGMIPGGAPAASNNQFTIASVDLDRFFDDAGGGAPTTAAYQARLGKASLTVRTVLNTPDIVGVQEAENLGVLIALSQRIDSDAAAAGQPAPNYQAHLIEGSDPDSLDIGVLVKTAGGRVQAMQVQQIGQTETFFDPADNSEDLLFERPSLVLNALVSGPSTLLPQAVTVIVNHLQPLDGAGLNDATGARLREQRRRQAEFLANYVQDHQSSEAIVAVGDFGAFGFNDGYGDSVGTIAGNPAPPDQVATASTDLVTPDLVNASELAPAAERYSAVVNGNAQALDHVLVSANLASQLGGVVRPRVNADFEESLRGDATTASRLSDRDPMVAYFSFPADVDAPVFADPPADQTVEATGPEGAVVNYPTPVATDNLDPTVEVFCTPASGGLFPLGNSGVTCSAQDDAGNPSAVSFTVSVVDTTAPALTVPDDVVEEAGSPAGATVTFAASATDAVTASPSVVCSPASGSVFALGTSTVSCTAQDAAGNTSTDSFTVTVSDTTAPVMTAPVNQTVEATSAAGAAVTFATSATDTVTLSPSIVCTPASGSVFALGATSVSCTAQDAAGNSSNATFTVTVQDTVAPVLSLPANVSAEATSASGRVVSFTATATDAVTASPVVDCTPASGSTFAIGETVVTCAAADAAGNVATGTFTVTVTSTTTAPVFGHLAGVGAVVEDDQRAWFAFDVRETTNYERGWVMVQVRGGRFRPDRYLSATVTEVVMSDAPGYTPSRYSRTGIDTVVFAGVGWWNGVSGYRYEIAASDRGEPGRGRDTFTLKIISPAGVVVESIGGVLRDGNIQSLR